MAAITLSVINDNNAVKVILFYVGIVLLSLLYIKVGLRLIRKEYNEKKYEKFKKKTGLLGFILILIIILNNQFLIIKSSIVIDDSSFINVEGNIYESYLETTKLDMPLSIDQDLQFILFNISDKGEAYPLRIYYKKHIFISKGKITHIETFGDLQ